MFRNKGAIASSKNYIFPFVCKQDRAVVRLTNRESRVQSQRQPLCDSCGNVKHACSHVF